MLCLRTLGRWGTCCSGCWERVERTFPRNYCLHGWEQDQRSRSHNTDHDDCWRGWTRTADILAGSSKFLFRGWFIGRYYYTLGADQNTGYKIVNNRCFASFWEYPSRTPRYCMHSGETTVKSPTETLHTGGNKFRVYAQPSAGQFLKQIPWGGGGRGGARGIRKSCLWDPLLWPLMRG